MCAFAQLRAAGAKLPIPTKNRWPHAHVQSKTLIIQAVTAHADAFVRKEARATLAWRTAAVMPRASAPPFGLSLRYLSMLINGVNLALAIRLS